MHGAPDVAELLECARCGGWYTRRPGAEPGHKAAQGHWPQPVREEVAICSDVTPAEA